MDVRNSSFESCIFAMAGLEDLLSWSAIRWYGPAGSSTGVGERTRTLSVSGGGKVSED